MFLLGSSGANAAIRSSTVGKYDLKPTNVARFPASTSRGAWFLVLLLVWSSLWVILQAVLLQVKRQLCYSEVWVHY